MKNILNILKVKFIEVIIILLLLLNIISFSVQSINIKNSLNDQLDFMKQIEHGNLLLENSKQTIFDTIKDDLDIQNHDSNWNYYLEIIGMDIQIHLEEDLPQNVFLVVNRRTKEFGFYYISDTKIYPYLTYYLDTRENLGNMFEFKPYLDELNGVYIHRYTGDYEDFNFQWAYAYDQNIGFLSTYELIWYPNDSLKINFMNKVEGS